MTLLSCLKGKRAGESRKKEPPQTVVKVGRREVRKAGIHVCKCFGKRACKANTLSGWNGEVPMSRRVLAMGSFEMSHVFWPGMTAERSKSSRHLKSYAATL